MIQEKRTVEFRPNSRNLFFHILTACNLSCTHCYINRKQHGTATLDQATIESWLRIFSMRDRRKMETDEKRMLRDVEDTNVIFLGGEPTMNPALAAGIKAAREMGYASITVDTNGYLFHDILDRVSPDQVDYFSFSIDGSCSRVNDPIRGKGSFDICTSGIRKAVEKGFSVSAIFTCSAKNIHDLSNMPELLRSLGVTRFFIQVIGLRGKSASASGDRLQLSRSQWQDIVPEVAVQAARIGLHVTWPKVFLEPDEEFICAGVAAENFFLFPNGRVYTCPLCEDYPLHAYEICDGRLKARPPLNESQLFQLQIPEGCVMNRLFHPGNIDYDEKGMPKNRIACCMLKEELLPLN